jgi:triosephosphate isomerase
MTKSRGVLIAGNWKMNYGPRETEAFFADLGSRAEEGLKKADLALFEKGKLKACIIPPCLSIPKAQACAADLNFPLEISAQNAHWEKKGAFTGETSGPILQEVGIHWVLVGHSERRQYFGETDQTVRKRAESLLAQGFQIILCIGESKIEREGNHTSDVLTRQLSAVFLDDSAAATSPGVGKPGAAAFLNGTLVIAYEPIWAIGTGLTATPQQAEEAHQVIRDFLAKRVNAQAAEKTPILYGGSVTPENVDSLLACANIDGALVGGASLKPDGYFALLKAGAKALGCT